MRRTMAAVSAMVAAVLRSKAGRVIGASFGRPRTTRYSTESCILMKTRATMTGSRAASPILRCNKAAGRSGALLLPAHQAPGVVDDALSLGGVRLIPDRPELLAALAIVVVEQGTDRGFEGLGELQQRFWRIAPAILDIG